jgi:hypothetical protein
MLKFCGAKFRKIGVRKKYFWIVMQDAPNVRCKMPDAGYKIQDARCGIQDTRCQMRDTRCKMQEVDPPLYPIPNTHYLIASTFS